MTFLGQKNSPRSSAWNGSQRTICISSCLHPPKLPDLQRVTASSPLKIHHHPKGNDFIFEWKTAVATLISIKQPSSCPKKMVHYVFQVQPSTSIFFPAGNPTITQFSGAMLSYLPCFFLGVKTGSRFFLPNFHYGKKQPMAKNNHLEKTYGM